MAFDGKLIHVNDWKRLEDGDLNSTAYTLSKASKCEGFWEYGRASASKDFCDDVWGSFAFGI